MPIDIYRRKRISTARIHHWRSALYVCKYYQNLGKDFIRTNMHTTVWKCPLLICVLDPYESLAMLNIRAFSFRVQSGKITIYKLHLNPAIVHVAIGSGNGFQVISTGYLISISLQNKHTMFYWKRFCWTRNLARKVFLSFNSFTI